jgi:hypothetical protein
MRFMRILTAINGHILWRRRATQTFAASPFHTGVSRKRGESLDLSKSLGKAHFTVFGASRLWLSPHECQPTRKIVTLAIFDEFRALLA